MKLAGQHILTGSEAGSESAEHWAKPAKPRSVGIKCLVGNLHCSLFFLSVTLLAFMDNAEPR